MKNIVEFCSQFNWVDIFVLIVFVRLIVVSLKQGLLIEIFKLLGTLSGLYLSLHYYFSFASYLNGHSGNKNAPGYFLEFFAYLILFAGGYLVFWLLRILIFRFVSAQVNSFLSKWGAFILSFLRSVLLVSVILFALLIPQSTYFKDSIRYSLSGNSLVKIAPAVYTWVWKSIVSKFNSGEKFNTAIHDVYSSEPKQIKKK
ncbi:MAG: CvpA family protein [Candidatus Omnitrophota bacterium]